MLAVSIIVFAVSAILGVFAAEDFMLLFRGFADHRPIISSDPYTIKGLILAPLALTLATLFFTAKRADPDRQRQISDRALRWTGRYLLLLLIGIVSALVAPIPQYLVVNYLALRRGYVPCPTPNWPRHQNDRWALPGPHGATEHCPGEGTDPNL